MNKNTSSGIQRTELFLMPSWTYTTYKVQGLSVDSAVVSFDLFKQKSFNCGQMYVVLSSMRSSPGLTLTGTFTETAVRANPRATPEFEILRLEILLLSQNFQFVSCDSLTIILLNERSLYKHSICIGDLPI